MNIKTINYNNIQLKYIRNNYDTKEIYFPLKSERILIKKESKLNKYNLKKQKTSLNKTKNNFNKIDKIKKLLNLKDNINLDINEIKKNIIPQKNILKYNQIKNRFINNKKNNYKIKETRTLKNNFLNIDLDKKINRFITKIDFSCKQLEINNNRMTLEMKNIIKTDISNKIINLKTTRLKNFLKKEFY